VSRLSKKVPINVTNLSKIQLKLINQTSIKVREPNSTIYKTGWFLQSFRRSFSIVKSYGNFVLELNSIFLRKHGMMLASKRMREASWCVLSSRLAFLRSSKAAE